MQGFMVKTLMNCSYAVAMNSTINIEEQFQITIAVI